MKLDPFANRQVPDLALADLGEQLRERKPSGRNGPAPPPRAPRDRATRNARSANRRVLAVSGSFELPVSGHPAQQLENVGRICSRDACHVGRPPRRPACRWRQSNRRSRGLRDRIEAFGAWRLKPDGDGPVGAVDSPPQRHVGRARIRVPGPWRRLPSRTTDGSATTPAPRRRQASSSRSSSAVKATRDVDDVIRPTCSISMPRPRPFRGSPASATATPSTCEIDTSGAPPMR